MKRILLSVTFFAALAVTFTSCLKDKGFEDGTYGINDPDTQPPGVGFPLGAKVNFLNTAGVNVSATAQAVNGIVYVKLLTGNPAATDVHVTIVINDALRTAYNTAFNPDIDLLPPALYTLPLTITIPAGQMNAEVPVTISNTTGLDPNKTYGIGITITAVDGGYTIAENLKNLLVQFTVKNKYHGDYLSNGYVYHPSAPRPIIDLLKPGSTSGANSIDIDWGDLGPQGYRNRITIDPVTNNLTITAAPGASGGTYTQMNSGLPTSGPAYTPQWAGSGLCNNTYNPTNKTFYIRVGYVGGTGWRVTEEHMVRQ
ncbi:MAG: DUF1735 domain-containing protein [Chitinophagaceae bacterium]